MEFIHDGVPGVVRSGTHLLCPSSPAAVALTTPGSLRSLLRSERRLAEREGFEPPDPCGSTVFKTAAIGHSATSPVVFGVVIAIWGVCYNP